MHIIGAGLSGAIAGALERKAQLIEAAQAPPTNNHRAVLRFRSDKIGQALNIPFRRVRVIKAIVSDGQFHHQVNPRLANMYARKVTGKLQQRSIGNLEPVDRFIAPEDLHARLLGLCAGRVQYGTPLTAEMFRDLPQRFISTIPLNELCRVLELQAPPLDRAPIYVMRHDVDDCDTFQTLYFPEPSTPVYRATLTGSLLIIEATARPEQAHLHEVLWGFGLSVNQIQKRDEGEQRYGKITPLDTAVRKALLHRITNEFGIFSLGRFATWRNILLDDVYDDFFKIRSMMELDAYDLRRVATQEIAS